MSLEAINPENSEGMAQNEIHAGEPQEMLLEDILKTRLWIYRFLTLAFRCEPSWTAFVEVARFNLFRELQTVEEDSAHPGLALLACTLDDMLKWRVEDWREAKEEYARLFIGPGPLPSKPWESVYRSKERIILDEHTLEVRAFYKKWGLEMTILNKEPDDHIGIELEFLAELTLRALNLVPKEGVASIIGLLKAQKTFLEEHLFQWVEEFCQGLSENTEHPLYRGIALFTPSFLRMDFELLQDLTSQGH